MNNRNEQLAQEAVEAFKNSLSAGTREKISETEYTELTQIVLETLQVQMSEVVDMVRELEKQLEKRAGRREMDL